MYGSELNKTFITIGVEVISSHFERLLKKGLNIFFLFFNIQIKIPRVLSDSFGI